MLFSRVTLAGPLWTLEEAKAHLYVTGTALDAVVTEQLDAAQEGVLAYLGPAADATWTPETAPKVVKHAVKLLLTHFFEHRGDDFGTQNRDTAVIWPELAEVLKMYRDPALA